MPSFRNIVLLVLMLVACILGGILRPTEKLADERPSRSLDMIVPVVFGDWQEDDSSSAQIIDPLQKEKIDRIYSQTLTRTYKNKNGYRVMLSIAYGTDQTDAMQVHKPEICYPAQGFVLQGEEYGSLALSSGLIPVTRILTIQGQRHEPVTYWITIGDHVVVSSGIQKKRVELGYALRGKIADGMLVRFSSIDSNEKNAFAVQAQFAAQMIDAISPESKPRFVGNYDDN